MRVETIGDCTLYCGDCAQVMAERIPDGSIDLTVTSPPYDNLRTYNGYTFDFEAIAAQLWRVTKPGGVVVWIVADATINGSETGTSFRQALHFMALGFNLHDTMIYRKANIGMYDPRNLRYKHAFEFMFIFSNGRPVTYNPIKDKLNVDPGRSLSRSNGRTTEGKIRKAHRPPIELQKYQDRHNVWEYYTGNNLTASMDDCNTHVAIFPEALARDHIVSWSNPGDVVHDPMMGSGTTGKMAVLTGRRFIGMDISDEYVDIACKRIEAATLQLRLPLGE